MSLPGSPVAQDVVRPSIMQNGNITAIPVTIDAPVTNQTVVTQVPATAGASMIVSEPVTGDSNYFYSLSARFREVDVH